VNDGLNFSRPWLSENVPQRKIPLIASHVVTSTSPACPLRRSKKVASVDSRVSESSASVDARTTVKLSHEYEYTLYRLYSKSHSTGRTCG